MPSGSRSSSRSSLHRQLTYNPANSWSAEERASIAGHDREIQWSLKRTIKGLLGHPIWSALLLIATLLDAVLTFLLQEGFVSWHEWIIDILFTTDLVLNLWIHGRTYIANMSGIFDFALVVILDLGTIFTIIGAHTCLDVDGYEVCTGGVRFLRIFRLIRLLRPIWQHTCCECLRRVVSQGKRRYQDPARNFDLDLTYIVEEKGEEVIALGLPAATCKRCSFSDGLFRNPLSEVVRFFDEMHSVRTYMIVNACPEKPYDERGFRTYQPENESAFRYVRTQDQTPPTLAQYIDFLTDVIDRKSHHHIQVRRFKPGGLGFEYDKEGIVKRVEKGGQADALGIQRLDKIVKILVCGEAPEPYSEAALNLAKEGTSDYNLTFEVGRAAIAVHCKAGMGRTGSLIVAWLMYRFAKTYEAREKCDRHLELPDEAYTFKGKMGIVCGVDGSVQKVRLNGQAYKMGITQGAKILLVDNDPYSEERLAAAEDRGSNYTVKVQFAHRGLRDADDCLNHFKLARTRIFCKCISKAWKGVETPSQIRYLTEYLHKLMDSLGNAPPEKLRERFKTKYEGKKVRLVKLKFTDLFEANERNLVVAVHQFQKKGLPEDFRGELDEVQQWQGMGQKGGQVILPEVVQWTYFSASDGDGEVTFEDLEVTDDTRISVFNTDQFPQNFQPDLNVFRESQTELRKLFGWPFHKKAGQEPGCLFFFFFHAGFLEEEQSPFVLKREKLDKACKKKSLPTSDPHITLEWSRVVNP